MNVIFMNCNVCGCVLRTEKEEEMGMCDDCAWGWQHSDEAD